MKYKIQKSVIIFVIKKILRGYTIYTVFANNIIQIVYLTHSSLIYDNIKSKFQFCERKINNRKILLVLKMFQ